jgi:hypothetical protein
MTETQPTGTGAGAVGLPRQRGQEAVPAPTGWVGWIFFAGIIMVLAGIFQAIAGIVALFNSTYYVVPSANLAVHVSYNGWGWVHLVVGIVLLLTGFGVMAGQTWARVVGIIIAGISAIVNLAFMAAFPAWALIAIVLDVLVIYALAVHGREMENY